LSDPIVAANDDFRSKFSVRGAGFDFSTGRVFGQLDRVLPILPSAGVVIEF